MRSLCMISIDAFFLFLNPWLIKSTNVTPRDILCSQFRYPITLLLCDSESFHSPMPQPIAYSIGKDFTVPLP